MPAAIFWVTIFENIACHAYRGKFVIANNYYAALPLYKATVHKSKPVENELNINGRGRKWLYLSNGHAKSINLSLRFPATFIIQFLIEQLSRNRIHHRIYQILNAWIISDITTEIDEILYTNSMKRLFHFCK